MKKILRAILLMIFLSLKIFAQCESEPAIDATGKILKELKIKKNESNTAAEFRLFVKASVKGASWRTKGAEAAVLTVFVDGKYNQDAILFAGEKVFEYQMLLGKLAAGEHQITIVLNEAHSAPNARNVRLQSVFSKISEDSIPAAKTTKSSIFASIAMLNAPVFYLRPDTIDKFSDIPLLTYYEIFDEPENVKRIRYTTIFTNEDGGTQSAALLARWGRMTDIEWVYEIRVKEGGEILSEIYQAANHETRNFTGKRFGLHPLFLDATVNNNFADTGCSPLRVSPMLVETNLSGGSRETVMDANPWTYRIMAEEAIRERRVNPVQLGANTIDDLRNYLYVEIYSLNNSATVAVETESGDGKTSRSDWNDERLRVGRGGFQRIAVRLSSNNSPVRSLSLLCYDENHSQAGNCQSARIVKFIRLDKNFLPLIKMNTENISHTLKDGERFTWKLF